MAHCMFAVMNIFSRLQNGVSADFQQTTIMSAPSHYSPASSADRTVSDPRAAYQARIDEIAVREKKLTRRDQRFVRLRIAVFVLAAGADHSVSG